MHDASPPTMSYLASILKLTRRPDEGSRVVFNNFLSAAYSSTYSTATRSCAKTKYLPQQTLSLIGKYNCFKGRYISVIMEKKKPSFPARLGQQADLESDSDKTALAQLRQMTLAEHERKKSVPTSMVAHTALKSKFPNFQVQAYRLENRASSSVSHSMPALVYLDTSVSNE